MNSNNKKPVKTAEQKKIDNLVKDKKKDVKTGQGLAMHNIDAEHDTADNAAQTTGGEQQGFQSAGRSKNYEIDYATTIEDAYDQLNGITLISWEPDPDWQERLKRYQR